MGQIRKRTPTRRFPDGAWEARWYSPGGRQKGQFFRTKREAQNHLRLMEGDKARGDYLGSSDFSGV